MNKVFTGWFVLSLVLCLGVSSSLWAQDDPLNGAKLDSDRKLDSRQLDSDRKLDSSASREDGPKAKPGAPASETPETPPASTAPLPGMPATSGLASAPVWTSRDGKSFKGWLTGFDFDGHRAQFRSVDGVEYHLGTEKLSFASKAQLLASAGVLETQTDLDWPVNAPESLLRVGLILLAVALLVPVLAIWVASWFLAPKGKRGLPRAVMCQILWLVVTVAAMAAVGWFVFGKQTQAAASPENVGLQSLQPALLVANGLACLLCIAVAALVYGNGPVKAIVFYVVAMVICGGLFAGIGFGLAAMGPDFAEGLLDDQLLRPLGLLAQGAGAGDSSSLPGVI